MTTAPLRRLDSAEEEILFQLLSFAVPDQDKLRTILGVALCRLIWPEFLQVEFPTEIDAGAMSLGVIANGDFEDADGVTAHFILHAKSWKLFWFELYKDKNSELSALPNPNAVDFYQGQ